MILALGGGLPPGFVPVFKLELNSKRNYFLSPKAPGKAWDLLLICHIRLHGIISIKISSCLQDPRIPDIAHGL